MWGEGTRTLLFLLLALKAQSLESTQLQGARPWVMKMGVWMKQGSGASNIGDTEF